MYLKNPLDSFIVDCIIKSYQLKEYQLQYCCATIVAQDAHTIQIHSTEYSILVLLA